MPDYIGADQDGPTAQYLIRVDHPSKFHFSIYEPVVIGNMPQGLVDDFRYENNLRAGVPRERDQEYFGKLLLEVRQKDLLLPSVQSD